MFNLYCFDLVFCIIKHTERNLSTEIIKEKGIEVLKVNAQI